MLDAFDSACLLHEFGLHPELLQYFRLLLVIASVSFEYSFGDPNIFLPIRESLIADHQIIFIFDSTFDKVVGDVQFA